MRTVRGLAALIALLLAAGVGAVALDAGPETDGPVGRDVAGNVVGDHQDSATCQRVLAVVDAGRRAEDLGTGVLDPLLVPAPERYVEVVEALAPTDIGITAVRPAGEADDELAPPTSHRQVLSVARLPGSLDDLADALDRRAADEGWTPAGEGTQSSDDRLVALLRRYQVNGRPQQVQAVACGRRGAFQHHVEPLRPSRLPPCAGSAVAARCTELEDLMAAVAGIPVSIEVLDGGRLQAVTHGPAIPVDTRVSGFRQVQHFQEQGWTWTNEADTGCLPWPSFPPGGGSEVATLEPGQPCSGGGAPLASAPAVLRFSRTGADGRYQAEVQTTPAPGTASVAVTFSASPA